MSEVLKLEKTLRKQTTSDDVQASKIASTAERILSLQPNHVYAMQCKSVALLHSGRFAAALSVLENLQLEATPFKNSATFHLHKAYCHYRLMQYTEARAELQERQQRGPMSAAARHLLAQIHYNLEEYAEAAAMYAELVADGAYRDDVEKQELLTNYTASLSACAPEKVAAVVRDEADEKTPDLLFNLATAQVEAQNYEAAQATLLQAEQLCAAIFPKSKLRSLKDALAASSEVLQAQLGVQLGAPTSIGGSSSIATSPERCFFNEVCSNWVQQAYVAFMRHREDDARRIVDLILTCKPSSAVTSAVAGILYTALQRSADFFDSHRKLKAAQHVKVLPRLTSKQLIAVQYNTALLQLSAGALDRCTRTVEQMEKAHPNNELTHSLRLVLAVRELKKKKPLPANSPSSASRPTRTATDSARDVQECVRNYEAEATRHQGAGSSEAGNRKRHRFLQLITAQLFLEQGDLAHAVETLKALEDSTVARRPTTVMTMAAWEAQIGDVNAAMALLRERLTATTCGYSIAVKKAVLLWAVQDLAMARGHYAAVGQLLKAVQAADASLEKDREVTALLVICLAETDLAAAKRVIATLDADAAAALSGAGSNSHTAPSDKQIEALVRGNPGAAAMSELGYRRVTAVDQEGAAADGGRAASGAGLPQRRRRAMRRPAKNMDGKPDPERWIPMSLRSYIKDLPERRKKELRRLRAFDQEQKRRAAAAASHKQKKDEQLQRQHVAEASPVASAA
ncbi:signal recognition particle protein, putative [Leishmania donovani]|uniref:Signal recognition particle subunit SRP72 n=1 Tax=Leishmania donovani TaxID=5661 RepID=E9BE74_LEIDO|nr:signal recognition particle protein, putative [Leishmania donovani]TPP50988.1 SRP72 RNA-binding domain family protein [Leishmania donovani]CBZ33550.1 signal recognition particle protein, putative [Leishmania donovani]